MQAAVQLKINIDVYFDDKSLKIFIERDEK